MRNALKMTAAALCCVALIACSQKGPADAALKAAEVSVNAVKTDGARYAPDQTKALLAAFGAAQESFSKGDYKIALEQAQGIPAKSQEVVAATAAKKDELTRSWTALATSLPAMIEQIKAKVDSLAAMKKLPKDFDAAKLEAAKASLADINQSWSDAVDTFKAGKLGDAVAKSNAVKAKIADEMTALGLTAAAPTPAPAAAPTQRKLN
jgi:hypothetical protein